MCTPTEILCHNTGWDIWANNVESVKHAKHMDLQNNFVNHAVESTQTEANCVRSHCIESDGITNPLD